MIIGNNQSAYNKIDFKANPAQTQSVSTSGNVSLNNDFAALNSGNVGSALRANALNAQPVPYKQLATFKIPYGNNEAKFYQLANGQKVIIMPKKGDGPTPTTINTYVKVGSMNEPDKKRGISHFIEHSLFNGSSRLESGEFVKKVNEMGGKYNASTGFATTNYYIQSVLRKPEDFDNMLDIHSDMLMNPTFSPEMIEKERGPVESEIQMISDDPTEGVTTSVLKNLFGINSTSGDLTGGSVETIKNLTREDVIDYYNLYYTPDNMTTIVVGDVNPDEAISKIARYFNSYKKSNPALKSTEELHPINAPVRIDKQSSLINSSMVTMAFAGPKNSNVKDTLVMNLLIEALAASKESKLNKDLSKFHTEAAMGQEVFSSDYNAPTAIMINTNFDPDKTEDGLKAIYQSIYSMQTTLMNPKELEVAKKSMKHGLKNIAEDSMSITRLVGGNITNSNSMAFCDMEKLIDAITPQDIMNAARTYLDLNKVSIGVTHPQQPTSKADGVSFGSSRVNFGDLISSKVKTFNLPNNIQTYYNENSDSTLAAFDVHYQRDDFVQINPAVPVLLGRIFQEGSSLRPKEELYDIAKANNVNFSFGVGNKGFMAAVDTESESLGLGVDLVNEILTYPALTQENLDKIKNELKVEYASSPKDPYDKGIEELYPNDPRGNGMRKVMENLDAVTLDDLKRFYSELRQDSKATATVTAPSSQESFVLNKMSQLAPASKPFVFKPMPASAPLTSNKVLIEQDEKNQAHIVQMFKINESGNIKDVAALKLMNLILGGSSSSRLFNDLREKQKLAYAVSSEYSSSPNDGILALDIMTTTEDKTTGVNSFENLQKSLNGFRNHLNMLMSTPVSAQELENAKTTLLNKLAFVRETTSGKTNSLSDSLDTYYGKDYIDELIKAIESTSSQDIQTVAQKYLSQPSVTSIVASKNTLEANRDYLSNLGEVKEVV